jgi:hypothetical protein
MAGSVIFGWIVQRRKIKKNDQHKRGRPQVNSQPKLEKGPFLESSICFLRASLP